MVVGLGTDLAEIARVARSIERFGERFLARVYTAGEIAYCQSKKNFAESFAARFAAKEAGAKALGTGISHGVSWLEFEVQRARSGKPSLVLHGRARELADRLGVTNMQLSLTHSRETAMAVVLLESDRSTVQAPPHFMKLCPSILHPLEGGASLLNWGSTSRRKTWRKPVVFSGEPRVAPHAQGALCPASRKFDGRN